MEKIYPSAVADFLVSNKLLRDNELCDIMEWSPETLRVKRSKGEAPVALKIKSTFFTRYEDLAEFIKSAPKIDNSHKVAGLGQASELSAQDLLK